MAAGLGHVIGSSGLAGKELWSFESFHALLDKE